MTIHELENDALCVSESEAQNQTDVEEEEWHTILENDPEYQVFYVDFLRKTGVIEW